MNEMDAMIRLVERNHFAFGARDRAAAALPVPESYRKLRAFSRQANSREEPGRVRQKACSRLQRATLIRVATTSGRKARFCRSVAVLRIWSNLSPTQQDSFEATSTSWAGAKPMIMKRTPDKPRN
jgi:hypothetical protein